MAARKYRRQAKLDAAVRFGPELSGLKALIAQAYEDRSTARQQATGTRRSVVSAVDEARPGVNKIYEDAGLAQARTAGTLVSNDLAGLGGVANSIKAGAALEQAGAADRLGAAQAQALGDLSQQRVAAVTGEHYAKRAAQTEFVSAVAKVLARRQDLAREQGAFIASETGKLRQDAADRNTRIKIATAGNQQSERNSLRSAGIDPDTGKAIPNGKLDPKAKKKGDKGRFDASHSDYKDATSQIGQALSALGTLDPDRDKKNRHDVGQLLLSGHKSQPIYTTDATGKQVKKLRNGIPVTTPDVPQIDQAYATAALDMYYDGHVSPGTVRLLHKLGLKVGRLPVKTRRQAPKQAPQHAGGIFGDVIAALGQ